MKHSKVAAVLVVAFVLLSIAAAATGQTTEYTLTGQVVNNDNDNPIYDAKLTFHNQMTSETTYEYTDASGHYEAHLTAGAYDVTVEAEDFDFSDQQISIYSDQNHEFRLDPISSNGDGSGDGTDTGSDSPFGNFDTSALESLIFIVLALIIVFFICLITITIALVAMFVRLGKVRKELGEINKNLDVLKRPAQPLYPQQSVQPPIYQQPQQGYQQPPSQ